MQNSLKVENKTTLLVVTALMMGVIMVLTMLIRIPSPTTKGYINLGDAAIFLSVIMNVPDEYDSAKISFDAVKDALDQMDEYNFIFSYTLPSGKILYKRLTYLYLDEKHAVRYNDIGD